MRYCSQRGAELYGWRDAHRISAALMLAKLLLAALMLRESPRLAVGAHNLSGRWLNCVFPWSFRPFCGSSRATGPQQTWPAKILMLPYLALRPPVD